MTRTTRDRAAAGGRAAVAVLLSCLTVAANAACSADPSGDDPAPASGGSSSAAAGGASGPSPNPAASRRAGHAPTADELAAARRDVATLSTPRLAAQLVVPRQTQAATATATGIEDVGYGGVAVFRENLPSAKAGAGERDRAQAGAAAVRVSKQANAAYARAVRDSGRDWPAFVSIDQEGGPVTRIEAPLTRFPAMMALGAAGDETLARQVGAATGAELAGLGYTVDMAPDADVTTGPGDPTIGVRSAGSDPAAVGRVSTAVALGLLDSGVLPTSKHFPGHGSVPADTHLGIARQGASLDALRARDLVPFQAAVRAGVPAVMTAHIVLSAVDAQKPASLSPAVIDGLLRRDLGFGGLVLTDALDMGAITKQFGAQQAAVLALQAGADVLLMPADPKAAVDAVVAAVEDGTLTRERLETSAARMVATLRASAAPDSTTDRRPGSHTDVAKRLAAASVTQLSGRCGARLVGDGIRISGGTATDREGLAGAARRAGLRVGSGTDVGLLGGQAYQAGSGAASGASRSDADVVVALDAPYGLASASAPAGRLATFGRTPETFDALVAVLTGSAPARGRLPVAVGDQAVGSGCGH